jgi:hypothetical protein
VPTTYPGREDEHDLGDGHSFAWMYDSDSELYGLIEHHPKGPDAHPDALHCGGYIAWRQPKGQNVSLNHQLVAGGPGDEVSVTVSPSLQCRSCPSHGFIRDGRWVPA